jgi:anti-sigma factor RsiW
MTIDPAPRREPAVPCDDRVGLIVRAADGALDSAEQARLEAHLATCERCRSALDAQRLAHDLLANWPETTAGPDFSARVLARIDRDRRWLDSWDFRRWTWRLSPLVAALALAAYMTVVQTAAAVGEPVAAIDADVPVSAALWSEAVSESDLVSLMLTASPDDPLAAAVATLEEAAR